jgi:hypothetical protein
MSRLKRFLCLSRLPLNYGDAYFTRGTPSTRTTSSESLVEIGHNEGHFTLVAETVSRPCLDYHCIAAMHTSYVALPAHTLQLQQVWSKSVSNEGHFKLAAETVFRHFRDYHCLGATHTSYMALPTHAQQP